MPIVDISKNGKILPEIKGKRVAVRLNNNTILYPTAEKLKKHGGKKGYIKYFEKEYNKTK